MGGREGGGEGGCYRKRNELLVFTTPRGFDFQEYVAEKLGRNLLSGLRMCSY